MIEDVSGGPSLGKTYNPGWDRQKLLNEFGINILTGEACAYSMRLLCDINEDGVKLIQDALGIEVGANSMRRHNSQVNGKPSLFSVMLTQAMMDELIRFFLVDKHLRRGEILVHFTPAEENDFANEFFWGGTEGEFNARFQMEENFYTVWNIRKYKIWGEQPHRGSYNVHDMTGRAP